MRYSLGFRFPNRSMYEFERVIGSASSSSSAPSAMRKSFKPQHKAPHGEDNQKLTVWCFQLTVLVVLSKQRERARVCATYSRFIGPLLRDFESLATPGPASKCESDHRGHPR